MSSMTKFNNDWRLTTIGEEFDIRLGKMLDEKKNVGQLKPYVGNRSVQWGRIDTSDLSTMALSIEDQKTYRLKQGDLLVCEGGEVGRCAIWNSTMECYYQKAIHRLRSTNGYRADLLAYYFEYWTSHDLLGDFVTKTSIAHLTKEKLAEIPLPVPSQQEQDAIASALSDMDALLAKLDQLIAKKRDIKQAAMQELLTGRRRLPGFSGEWKHTSIGEVCEVKTGPFGSSLHESDYVKEGTPIITVEHLGEFGVTYQNLPLVSKQDWTRLREYTLEAGDIVFSRVGSVDRNALIKITEDGWLFSGRLLRVRVKSKNALASFLSHQFHLESFKKKVREVAVGQTMASINTQILKNIQITLPPTDEQAAIALIISEMNTEVIALEARREKTRRIKQGMMQELLSGRVRLI